MMYLLISVAFAATATVEIWANSDCSGDPASSSEVSGDGSCGDIPNEGECVDTGMNTSMKTTCSGGLKCFDTDMIVDTPNGAMRMGEIKIGDSIRDSDGDFSEVVGFLHRDLDAEAVFHEIHTTMGIIRLSDGHILETTDGYKQAMDVEVGDWLVGLEENAEVTDISEYKTKGLVAPLTQSGTVLANGFKASCYAYIPASMHWVANAFFWPRRYLMTNMNSADGIDTYAAFWLSFAGKRLFNSLA